MLAIFALRDFGHVSPWIYVLPIIGAWQLARGFERHRALLPLIEKSLTGLLVSAKTDGGAWMWSDGAAANEAPRRAERAKPRPKRRGGKLEGPARPPG